MLEDWTKRDINTLRRDGNPEKVAIYVAIRLEDPFSFFDDDIFNYLTAEEQVLLDVELQKTQLGVDVEFNLGSYSRKKWNPETIDELLEGLKHEHQIQKRDREIRRDD